MRTGYDKFNRMSSEAEQASVTFELYPTEEKFEAALRAHKAAEVQGREVLPRVKCVASRVRISALVSFHQEVISRMEKGTEKSEKKSKAA